MIKKAIFLATGATLLALYTGCANCPVRNWWRGAACNTCQPPVGQPIGCGTNYAPSCDSGVCGAPIQSTPFVDGTVGDGPFIEAPSYAPTDASVPYYSSPAINGTSFQAPTNQMIPQVPSAEVYGNGAAVMPPSIGPFQGSGTRN